MSTSSDHSRLSPGMARSLSQPSRNSRNSSVASLRYSPENLVLPQGQIDQDTVQLLHEFVHPHHHEADETLVEDSVEDSDFHKLAEQRRNLPWHKRPSPWWFLVAICASAFAVSATLAPRIEIYTQLACESHKPNYTIGRGKADYTLYTLYNETTEFSSADIDERKRLCATDPDVQAAVATLVMVFTTTMGILGCLTTGWWTSLSDRLGRVRVLGYTIFGLLFADFNFVFVARFSSHLPGTYWWFILGAFVEGLFGSLATMNATIHAYMADTVEPHERAHIFSLTLGLLFCGFAVGPTIGGLIVHFTGVSLSVFYLSAGLHIVYAIMLWFLVPESLSSKQLKESRRQYNESVAKAKRYAVEAPILSRIKRLFGFLSPLSVLGTTVVTDANPLKAKRGDWSLTLMAMSSGFALLLMGSYSYKFQYTSAVFGWTSQEIGYWLSIVAFCRALYLTLVLPLIIKLFKPKPPAIQLPTTPSEPLQRADSEASAPPPAHSISFDLNLARFSVFIELIAFAAIPFIRNPLVFTGISVISCLGAGHAPAAQSVALTLYTQKGGTESGKLLGALSVLQVVSSQILGPALFGLVYVNTVATVPATIFFVSSAIVAISFILLLFIRLPKISSDVEDHISTPPPHPTHTRDETLVDVDVPIIVVDASPKVASPRS